MKTEGVKIFIEEIRKFEKTEIKGDETNKKTEFMGLIRADKGGIG